MTEKALREAIIHEIDKNWFVEAGAGAGKTWIIVERIIEQLKSGRFLPEHIVVITFTRKAAGELSERIVKRLQAIMDENSKEALNDAEKKNLKNALENIEQMTISTIHSFCYKLLVSKSFESNVPLDAVMLEDEADQEEKRRIFDQWYRSIGYTNYKKLKEQHYAPKETLFQAFLQIADLPKDTAVIYDDEILTIDFNGQAERLLEDYSERLLDKINEIGSAHYSDLRCALSEPFLMKDLKKVILMLSEKSPIKVLKKLHACKFFKASKDYLKRDEAAGLNDGIHEAMTQKVSPLLSQYNDQIYCHSVFMSMALEARDFYKKHKDSHFLTNDDLLQKAGALVRESPKARAAFMKQYRCIYVDEFQDTDHVQAEMILNLCGEKTDGKHYRLRPGNLFVVGDPKQSIYRFRGAELDVFYWVREIFSDSKNENGCIASLHWNFRSNPILLNEWINPNFERRFKGLFQDLSMTTPPGREYLTIEDQNLIEGIYCSEHVVESQSEKSSDLITEDALTCCRLIKNLVYGGKMIRSDESKNSLRPIQFSDFLILTRNKKGTEKYFQIFQEQQIPIDITGQIDLSVKRIFNRFVRIYSALALPSDVLAVNGALEVFCESGLSNPENQLSLLIDEAKKYDGYALSDYLLHRPELYCDRDVVIEKAMIKVIQAQLIQMIEAVIAVTPNDAGRLADAFKLYIERTLEQQLKLSECENAVRLMNLHKAKGLEGRIVIIAMRNESLKFRQSTHQERLGDKNIYYPTIKMIYGNHAISVPGYRKDSPICEKAKKAETEENMRLEYVAATRAEEALFFMDALNDKCTFLEDFDFSNCQSIEPFLEDEPAEEREEAAVDYSGRDIRAQLDDSQRTSSTISLSPSNFEKQVDLSSDGEKEDRPKGNIFGNMLHRTFELLVPQIRENIEINSAVPVKRAIMEYMGELSFANEGEKQDDLKKIEAYLLQCAADFVNDPILTASIQQADKVLTELPFGYTLSKDDAADFFADMQSWLARNEMSCCDDQKIYIHGSSDLVLIRRDDGGRKVIIVDYKSDVRNGLNRMAFDEVLKKRYTGQMTLYRHAISHVLQVPKDKISVVIRDLYGGWVKI